MLLAVGEEEGNEEEDQEEEMAPTMEAKGSTEETLGLSMNLLKGMAMAKTMKINGTIGEREVIILLDSGASHSFIAADLVHSLSITTYLSVHHKIEVGNSMSFQQRGMCRGVRVLVQGFWVVEDFFPFDLRSVDLVLGISWMRTLGEVHAD